MPTAADERLESLSTRLDTSPALREAVARALADRRLPPELVGAVSDDHIDQIEGDAGRLESLVAVDRLEAIVRLVGRPPLIIRNGIVELEDLSDFPAGTDALIKGVEPTVGSVGRVEFVNHPRTWEGTGWVVAGKGSKRTVVTNRHVASKVAQRSSDGTGTFLRNPGNGALYQMFLDFKEEVDSQPGDAKPFRVTRVDYLADATAADVALLTIEGDGLPSPLKLADADAELDELVGLIGYPAYDPRNDANAQAKYFKGLYEVKRFAPGRIMQSQGAGIVLMHDCTSLGGNSGSPLLGLETGKVVGLHFAGEYGVSNSAISARTIRELVEGKRPVSIAVETAKTEGAADGQHPASHFADRAGYDPAFLGGGVTAPWPNLSGSVQNGLAAPSDATADRPTELRYTHFGVQYSAAHKQPALTAVNIDGAHTVHVKRKDKWFSDGRIDPATQLNADDYEDPAIDRGHMVRREDPNWDPAITPGPGVTSVLAELADNDTFHYTNAAPQHGTLNQGKQLWQGLENYILDNARTKGFRACVFTGPVFRADDPEIKPGVRAPLEFWKLVAMVDADTGGLHATAYLLSQGQLIRDLLEKRSKVEGVEGFVLGEYRTFQIAVRDLAEATEYDFSAYLAADPLAQVPGGQEAIATNEPLFLPLTTLDDIVT